MKPNSKRKQILFRYGLVTTMILFMAILIVIKAVGNTIIDADNWNRKADSTLNRVETVLPVRGDILACDGSVLATNLTYYTLYIDFRANAKRQVEFVAALDSLADSLATYYPTKYNRDTKAWHDYLSKELKKDPKKRKTNVLLLKDVSYADYQRVLAFPFFKRYKSKYKHGLTYETREMRNYPYGSMARRSIGRVNETPRKDNSNRKGEIHGYSGLEYALDSLLFGRPGKTKLVALTHAMSNWVDVPAVNGSTITTTIDINMQDMLENELNIMLDSTGAEWGTAMIMEVKTGDIKAISNLERDSTGNYVEAWNRCLLPYEPGSVMKPISMIVALEDGFAFPLERTYSIEGGGYHYAGGKAITDTHSPSYLPVSRFIEYSSNIGMTKLVAPHFEKDPNSFRERLRKIGLFDTLRTGIAGERPPYFPSLDIKAGGLVSLSRQTYGYATQIPPLYICAIYNAIANDGKFVRPRLVKKVTTSTGIVEERPITYVRDSILSRKNAKILREMLRTVVTGEGGTARRALNNSIVPIAGKTGTARVAIERRTNKVDTLKINGKDSLRVVDDTKQKRQDAGYTNRLRLAFCGFFPYDDPQYTCIVVINAPKPQYRSAAFVCGMVLRNVAEKFYSRGLLGNSSDYRTDNKHGGRKTPVLFASDDKRNASVKSTIGAKSTQHYPVPAKQPNGKVPSVVGMGMRDAVLTLENAGYKVKFTGNGHAVEQTPKEGQELAKGSTVNVRFSIK